MEEFDAFAWVVAAAYRLAPGCVAKREPRSRPGSRRSTPTRSGSPVVTKDLRVVGFNFDRNIDALVRDYIYLPERGRNVMVDVRAIQAALDKVYGARRVVTELLTGELGASDATP